VSNWILYDELVDLVRNHHHESYSGLITGLSDRRHSFQVGFNQGQIILLSYRIKKGLAALPLITQIERAKITDHPTTDIAEAGIQDIDTSLVLSQLTATTLDDTTTSVTDISDISAPQAAATATAAPRKVDERLRGVIEAAAVHHFGPIGAMVCEEHLQKSGGDLRTVLQNIAIDVGASEADTKAFFKTISEA